MFISWYVLLFIYLGYGFLIALPAFEGLPEIRSVSWYTRHRWSFLIILLLIWPYVCMFMYYMYRTQEFYELFGIDFSNKLGDARE